MSSRVSRAPVSLPFTRSAAPSTASPAQLRPERSSYSKAASSLARAFTCGMRALTSDTQRPTPGRGPRKEGKPSLRLAGEYKCVTCWYQEPIRAFSRRNGTPSRTTEPTGRVPLRARPPQAGSEVSAVSRSAWTRASPRRGGWLYSPQAFLQASKCFLRASGWGWT